MSTPKAAAARLVYRGTLDDVEPNPEALRAFGLDIDAQLERLIDQVRLETPAWVRRSVVSLRPRDESGRDR